MISQAFEFVYALSIADSRIRASPYRIVSVWQPTNTPQSLPPSELVISHRLKNMPNPCGYSA